MLSSINSYDPIRVEEIPNDKLLQFLTSYFSITTFIYDLHVRCDVSRSWLEAFVHRSITVYQPFSYFYCLTYSISISIIGLYDLSEL